MSGAYRSGVPAVIVCLLWAIMPAAVGAQPPRTLTPPDISGEWALFNDEDPGALGALGQPPLGDYLGIPFNEAGRMRADTSAESIWGTPEYQCRPHSAPHQWRGLGGARILKEQDPLTREIKAYHIQFMRSLDWPVFMDGRPHPPAWAPHTRAGFFTGGGIRKTPNITTTHLKDGYLKRGGPQTSDMYLATDFLTRHGDTLTIVTSVDDPIYMEEPYVESTTYTYDLTSNVNMETCNGTSFAENGGTDRHHVPHFLPGQNTALTEWLKKDNWIPVEPTRGGAVTTYPEYRANAPAPRVPMSKTAVDATKAIGEQSPRDGQVHLLPVQGNVYMLVADGTNIAVSMGADGVMLVNTGAPAMADKVLAAINQLANVTVTPPGPNTCFGANCPGTWGWASPYMNSVISSPAPPRPIRYIVNTSAAPEHAGGNEKIASAGFFPRGASFGAAVEGIGRAGAFCADDNVQNRLSNAPAPAQPTDTFFDEFQKLPEYFNGEAVIL